MWLLQINPTSGKLVQPRTERRNAQKFKVRINGLGMLIDKLRNLKGIHNSSSPISLYFHHSIPKHANPLDLCFHHITMLKKFRWVAGKTYPARRARRDNIARL